MQRKTVYSDGLSCPNAAAPGHSAGPLARESECPQVLTFSQKMLDKLSRYFWYYLLLWLCVNNVLTCDIKTGQLRHLGGTDGSHLGWDVLNLSSSFSEFILSVMKYQIDWIKAFYWPVEIHVGPMKSFVSAVLYDDFAWSEQHNEHLNNQVKNNTWLENFKKLDYDDDVAVVCLQLFCFPAPTKDKWICGDSFQTIWSFPADVNRRVSRLKTLN